jgi:peptidyl-tRNA hydrolase, PTH1 family
MHQEATSPGNSMWLIAGLGNPGPRFVGTRHNIGFVVADELAKRNGLRFAGKQANAEVAKGTIEGQPVILAKPLTYMNNSGQSIGGLSRFYKIPHNRILIVYDDIALPVGTIRLREKGSAGGHNGLTSVLQHLGTQNVARLRVGVDRPPDPRHNQIDWVLGHFKPDERKKLDDVIARAAEAVEAVLKIGMERAMNTYNTTGTPEPPRNAGKLRNAPGAGSKEAEEEREEAKSE